jgi:membrane protein implicated in regulation of membrane protease activity
MARGRVSRFIHGMTIVFLASFVAGLLLGVRVMMYGVERPREAGASGERSFRLSPPIIVAFAVVFGLAGYILSRRPTASPVTTTLVAAVLGAAASIAAARLVSAWGKVTPEHDVDDERYVLQGHLARVVKPIEGANEGEVAFEVGDQRRVVRARSVDDVTMSAGTEVVIERIEDDVAFVEPWLEVEKRL